MDKEDPEDVEEAGEIQSNSDQKPWFKNTLIIILSIFAVIIVAVGSYWVINRQIVKDEQLRAKEELRQEFERYSVPSFGDSQKNHVSIDYTKPVPGSSIDLKIEFANTGAMPVQDFYVTIKTPQHTRLAEDTLDGHDYERAGPITTIYMGDIEIGKGGMLSLSYIIESPLENGTEIGFEELYFNYTKTSELLEKRSRFKVDMGPQQVLSVESSPSFDTSFLTVNSIEADEGLDVTFGDSIRINLFIFNSGDTYSEDTSVRIYGLSDLEVAENQNFHDSGSYLEADIGDVEPNNGKVYSIDAVVMEDVEDDQLIEPYAEVVYGGGKLEIPGPDISVRLFPSFEGSGLRLVDINGQGVYSGDIVDASITITNTGDTAAEDIIVDLVFSNLFGLFEGTNHWELDSLEPGENQILQSRLQVAEGITSDSYATAGFTVKADDMDKFVSQDYSILVTGAKPFTRNLIPIVGIHGVEPSPKGAYELSTQKFDYLCGTLKSLGYETITFRDLLDYIDYGKTLPEKPVIIASDDGYRSVYTHAFPILQKYGYKMTVFLVTGLVGNSEAERRFNEFDFSFSFIPKRPLLIWPEVLQMSRYGCEFLSHSVTHRILGGLSTEEVAQELAVSKQTIESRLGKAAPFISWPHDNYTPELIAMLPQFGYRGAVRYSGGVEDVRSINIYAIKRVPIFANTDPGSYASLLKLQ